MWAYSFFVLALLVPKTSYADSKPTITSATTATGQTGVAFNYQIAASNSPTSFGATNLPAGLSVDTVAGLISGTPMGVGTTKVTITATNAGGNGTATLTITVNPPIPVITSAATATGQVGVAFSYKIAATNTPKSYSATGLPAGLSVDLATGKITGTPTTMAVSTVTISATNATGTGTATLTITVNPPKPDITSATTATGQTGVAFNYQIAASNSPTSFGATNLPAGMNVDTVAGLISGTPTGVGTTKVTITATNAGGNGMATLTITVNPPTPLITSETTATGQIGVVFNYKIAATNTPTSYNATGLPAGLSVSTATGRITGTPTAVGTSTVTIAAANATGTATATLTITVLPAKPAITSVLTATGVTGVAFSYQIVADNGPTSFGATNLPAGLNVDTAGLISGTPIAAGTTRVTITATNAGGNGTATLTITVNPPTPVITSAATATGQVGVAFSYKIAATNTPTSYNATGLPAGLSVSTVTGRITGTPITVGTSTVHIAAANATGTATATLTITVLLAKPAITSALTATAQIGERFIYQITGSNSPTSVGAANLPAGLSIDPVTGVISGTPTTAGLKKVTLSATNAQGTGTATLTITIYPAIPMITSAANATGQMGTPFSFKITATYAPTSYSAAGLPPGLTVAATSGKISGTPTVAGIFTISLSAVNSVGTGTATLTITVKPAKPAITSAATASGMVGAPFRYQITASNAPTSFAATKLPAGLSLNFETGLITGIPTAKSTSSVIIRAINAGGTGSETLKITIAPDVPSISSSAIASGEVAASFNYRIIASGRPTTYSALGLPDGLTLNSATGVISGKPTAIGVSTVTLGATNATGTGTATLILTINQAKVAAPSFAPRPGTYPGAQPVAIVSKTSGATIRYTTDGSTPTETGGTVYSGPVDVATSTTLRAIAFKNGYTDSNVTVGAYTINSGAPAAAPVFAAAPGVFSDALDVTITSATSGASINYTTDGSTPTETNGTPYFGPVNISSTTVLKAIAYESGFADSGVTSGLYSISSSPSVVLNVMSDFSASTIGGISPWSGVVQGSDGNFYGTTESGGAADLGTVFQMTPAGVVTTLASFNGSNGAYPEGGLVQGTDGNFYGTTAGGGASGEGTVFQMTPAGVLTTLVSLDGANGSTPEAGLVQGTDGNFYGTTQIGGSSNQGTIFVISPVGVLTTLVSFAGANGSNPAAALVQGRDGNFYGTTQNGGSALQGTVFVMSPGGMLTTLVSFAGGNGANPEAALIQGSDGNFYGTTAAGGNSSGTVFVMTPSGRLTTLCTFSGSNGYGASSSISGQPGGSGTHPQAPLVQGSDGNFYGTTSGGGSSGQGTIFEMSPSGSLFTLLSFNGANGSDPYFSGLVQGTDGNFYGTTASGGGSVNGTIYQMIPIPTTAPPVFSPASGAFTSPQTVAISTPSSGTTIVYTTDGSKPTETNGTTYSGPVTISRTTRLNAIAFGNGLADSGVTSGIYTINSVAVSLTTLNSTVPAASGLVEGSDGNFYGTTYSGGESGLGSVFMITPSGERTTLYSFIGTDGGQPGARLVQGDNGNFYGTTGTGGSFGYGTVFAITPSGLLTTLISFNNTTGEYPTADLVQGQDGNFYGVTSGGWNSGNGTVFKITPAGVLTTLVSFNGQNGSNPLGALIQGKDGNFYGTTISGGDWGNGTVYVMTPTGVLTTLVSFSGGNGSGPAAPLVQGTDGNFYGTTTGGGDFNNGTVFMLNPSGALTTLASFNYFDGSPWAGLIQGNDGNFYGTTAQGGSFGYGTIFMVTPSGALSILVSFNYTNGAYPYAPLLQGTDGAIYGATQNGGDSNLGVVFKLTFPPAAPPAFSPAPGSYPAAPTVTMTSTTNGASIIYTTDGSTPTQNRGTLYAGPVTLSTTATINAIAYASGYSSSAVASAAYALTTPLEAAPQFSPLPGTYVNAQTVTITSATGNAAIAYTTDGSTPTEIGGIVTHGTLYSAPVTLGGAASTLNAIAFAPDAAYQDSPVASGTYINTNPPLQAPVLSVGGGTYTGSISVTMTCAGSQTIYYTTDGSTPTTSSPVFASPVVITRNTVLQAIGVNNLGAGPAASASYTILPPAPTFSPAPGTYADNSMLAVTISDGVSATIYFTIDGSTPTAASTPYTGAISLPVGATTLSAVAINVNGGSAVTSREYILTPSLPQAPVLSLPGGTYDGVQSVAISSAGATAIYYTTDGSTPSASSTLYIGPVSLSTSGAFQAVGVNSAGYSPVSSVTYTIVPIPSAPTFNALPGIYSVAQTVSITSVGATAIYYTVNGGPPGSSSALYTGPILVAGNATLQAVGVNGFGSSAITSGVYTIIPAATAPVFSPAPGSFSDAQNVTMTTPTAGATIVYTTDGSIPTEDNGTVYSGPVSLGGTTMLRAIAFAAGAFADSAVTSGIYTIGASAPVLNVVYDFPPVTAGSGFTCSALAQGGDGSFYGTTSAGGSSNLGTVFKMTGSGVVTTLVSFDGNNGATPRAGLVQGSDGNFYGTTWAGGDSNLGTVFSMTPGGVLSTMASFTGVNGASPLAGLVQANDGNFYGTTYIGGSFNSGTVFRMTPAGVLTTLVSFDRVSGYYPLGELVQGVDGNLYGTAANPTTFYTSSAFSVTLAGLYTNVAVISGYTVGALVQGNDGSFYGTTSYGGWDASDGTVFKMTPTGAVTTLVAFNGGNGAVPRAGLVQGRDGNFYGTTATGSAGLPAGLSGGDGTVFQMTPAGGLTTLASFDGANGSGPCAGLIQGVDGNFYGTAGGGIGGAVGPGVIFQLIVQSVSAPVFSPPPGYYLGAASVAMSTSTAGATIRYTVDGSTPSETNGTIYSGPVPISNTAFVQAIAYLAGVADSPITSGSYTILQEVSQPAFSLAAGTFTSPQSVAISSATSGSTIRYTTDGTSPSETSGTIYSGPVLISSSTTLKAIAYESGFADSGVAAASYTIVLPPQAAAAPTFSPAGGSDPGGNAVTISTTTPGASIRYTTDGSIPTKTDGTLYTGPVVITAPLTLSAIAYGSGFPDSAVTTATIGKPTVSIITPANGSTVP